MQATTAMRQAMSRAVHPTAARRHIGALRLRLADGLGNLHRAYLRTMISWAQEDIQAVDRDMEALPYERLDLERSLLGLEARLRSISAGSEPAVLVMGRTGAITEPRVEERFLRLWLAGSTPFPVCACTSHQLYQAFLFWAVGNAQRFLASHREFTARAGSVFAIEATTPQQKCQEPHHFLLDAVRVKTADVWSVQRCWVPANGLPLDPMQARTKVHQGIERFDAALRQANPSAA